MNLRFRRRRPKVELVTYTRSGKLRRRTTALYPEAPPPPFVVAAGSFALLDWEMEQYMADLRQEQSRRSAAGERGEAA